MAASHAETVAIESESNPWSYNQIGVAQDDRRAPRNRETISSESPGHGLDKVEWSVPPDPCKEHGLVGVTSRGLDQICIGLPIKCAI